MDKKIITILRKLFLLNWPYDMYKPEEGLSFPDPFGATAGLFTVM